MPSLPFYWVDAFASRAFEGNPAAVVPLEHWLPDALMQAIAAQNGLPVTAFFVREGGVHAVRWFTPRVELELCGHGTLASAFVITTLLMPGTKAVTFTSRGGTLAVARQAERLALDLPARTPVPIATPAALVAALGRAPVETLDSDVYVAVFAEEAEIRALAPDMAKLASLERRGVAVTAPGTDADFVSRYFAPKLCVPEDPVTGSAHCKLAPYWSRRSGKSRLHARQLSARGGELWCEDRGERVRLDGTAVLYMEGTLHV
jgi:PhzF family phenazine biosynthesis protein